MATLATAFALLYNISVHNVQYCYKSTTTGVPLALSLPPCVLSLCFSSLSEKPKRRSFRPHRLPTKDQLLFNRPFAVSLACYCCTCMHLAMMFSSGSQYAACACTPVCPLCVLVCTACAIAVLALSSFYASLILYVLPILYSSGHGL